MAPKLLLVVALAFAISVQGTLGVFLPKLCEALRSNGRREMAEIQSSGLVNDKAISPSSDPFEVAVDIDSNEAALISARGITGERKLIFGQLLKGAPIPSSHPSRRQNKIANSPRPAPGSKRHEKKPPHHH
ncbi:hypothetical protein OROHE_009867 [Orobanche hederae]